MMIQLTTVTAMFTDLPAQELTGWIERGWVQPETAESGWVFQEIDIARVRLIHDLRRDMDVGEDTIPMVLSLLDQVYELRAQLKALLRAVEAQPPEVRQAIQANLSRFTGEVEPRGRRG
jgi:chaperone modulatory protein CbpM